MLNPIKLSCALLGLAAYSYGQAQLPPAVESAVTARMEVLAKAGTDPAPPSAYTPVRAAGARGGAPYLATFKDSSGISIALQSTTATTVRTLSFLATMPDVVAGAALRKIRLAKVVDAAGKDLLIGPAQPPPPTPTATGGRGGARPLAATATIQKSDRDATAIAIIEGTAEIFSPSAANGTLVTVKGISERSGKPIEELQRHGVEFTVVTPTTYLAMPESPGIAAPDFNAGPVVFISDPGSVLVGYSFRDSTGNALPTTASSSRKVGSGTLYELRFQAAGGAGRGQPVATTLPSPARTTVPADGQIIFYVGLPEAIRTVSFHFENIAIP